MNRALPFVIIAAVLVAALLTVWYLTRSTAKPSATTPASNAPPLTGTSPLANTANTQEPGAEPPHALGPADAPATLEEFGDFECPPCGLLHPILKTMHGEFVTRL